tara:strand:+ start:458 stop:1774 length:1317 start_codon:yes stop_codon:yes gene_type:complete
VGNTRNLGDLLNTDSTIATADVADGGITTAKLADTAVTTAKITDANITTAKLASNAVTTAKITDGNISTAKLADDAVTGAKIENNPTIAGNLTVSGGFIPSSNTSGKNMIINGAMKVHQRVATLTHDDKAVDRFKLVKNNLDTADFSTRHYVAGEAEVREFGGDSLEIKCTTADTSIGANELIYVVQNMEAQYLRRLSFGTANAKTTTISFYVYSNVTGNYAFTLVTQDGTARNIGGTYTINSANTWEKKTLTFSGDASATINNDNGHGLDVCWILSAGSNWTSTDNTSWANYANGRLAYGHNVNIASAVNKYWYLTGVQWEEGSVATPFEQENIDVTKRKCQRYYFKPDTQNNFMGTLMAPDGNANDFIGQVAFPVEMRATPTYTGTPVENGTEATLGGMTSHDINKHCISFVRMTNDGNAGRRGLNVRGEVSAELT